MYLTDLKNTATEIQREKDDAVVVRKYGSLPLLVQQGKVEMTFRMPGRPAPKIWALKYDGSRSLEILPKSTPDGFSFEAQAVINPETYALYELAWE